MSAYNYDPKHSDEYKHIDEHDEQSLTLLPVFSGTAFREAVQYPIIVEMWDKVVGRAAGGRMQRAFHAQFTQAERKLLGHYHTLFYRWHLVSGTPKRVACKLNTLQILQRAVEFFATI